MLKCNSFKVAKVISFLAVSAFFVANTWMSYYTTFYAFIVYEVSVGMLYPSYSQIKAESLPEKTRGTLMNIFKIPVNILVVYLLIYMNTMLSLKGLIMVCFFFAFIVLILHISYFKKDEEIYGHYADMKKSKIYQEQEEIINKKKN